jgi:hypothetical protein
MRGLLRSVIKKSQFAQRIYRRHVHPHLRQYELETYILRGMRFDQCVDVGANLGIYSVLLSRQSNLVYAFEPVRSSFEKLAALQIRNVRAYNLALGNENRKMEMSFPTFGRESLATLRYLSKDQDEKNETPEVEESQRRKT